MTIIFIVKNSIHQLSELQESFGTGLVNLKRRLSLIYEEDYTLETKAENGYFTATLKIPLN